MKWTILQHFLHADVYREAYKRFIVFEGPSHTEIH